MGNECCQTDNTVCHDIKSLSDVQLLRNAPLPKREKVPETDRETRSTAKELTEEEPHHSSKTPSEVGSAPKPQQGFHRTSFPDGTRYEGEFVDGLQHGSGRLTYPNKDYYEGEWRHGKPNGTGRYVSSDGYQYDGGWLDNDYSGHGQETYADGVVFKGHFEKGKKSGHGKLWKANGEFYEGEFKNDRFHGKGKCVWPGQVYDGDWYDSEVRLR